MRRMGEAGLEVRGDGGSGFKAAAWMFAAVIPGLALYQLLGERSFVGIMAACFAGVLGLLSPIPLVVGWRLAQSSVTLRDGRLRVTNSRRAVEIGIAELENVMMFQGTRGPAILGFQIAGEWVQVDPRGLDPAGVDALMAAIRTARPDLPFFGRSAGAEVGH